MKLVTGGYVAAILLGIGWAVWSVLAATELEEIAGGWLGQDATVASVPLLGQLPWFALMFAVGGYAIWQCIPHRRIDLHRTLRPWVLGIVLLNALWVGSLHNDQIGLSLCFGVGLLAVLVKVVVMIDRSTEGQRLDRWITRACFGLFTGWLSVMMLAESVAFAAVLGSNPDALMFKGTCALALLLLALFLCAVSFKNPMGIYVNAGALWVISWIILDRYTGPAASPTFATVSTVAAVLMLLCLLSALRTRLRQLRCQ